MYNLGGIERKKDYRDFSLEKYHSALGAVGEITKATPIDINLIPYNWQSNYPFCGAHALAHFAEYFELKEQGKPIRLSPIFGWKEIKKVDGYPPEVGTDMRSIFKIWASKGICEYDLLPTNYSLSLQEQTDPSTITPQMEENAQPRIISNYGFLTKVDFASVKNAIDINGCVLILLRCDGAYWGTEYPPFFVEKYGHFVIGVKTTEDEEDKITILCSSDKGHAVKKVDKKYINFIKEVGTAVDLSNEYVKSLVMKKSLLQQLLIALQKLQKLLFK